LKRLKLWARATEALVMLAGLAVLSCVLSLEDVINGDVYPEWTIIRVSFIVIVLCLIATFVTLYHLFRHIESDEGARPGAGVSRLAAAGPASESAQGAPAARRTSRRTLPGKRPSTKAARAQRKRTK